MKIKITDVAKYAGVSATTVSHVINKTRFVSEETTKRVNNAIEVLGYVPNIAAQGFKTGKKMMIGFVVPDITNPVFSQLIEYVEDTVSTQGFRLVVSNSRDCLEQEKRAIRSLTCGLVDGLLIASSAKNFEELKGCIPEGFPFVLVDRELEQYEKNTVTMDCYGALRQMVETLIDAGHKKIGYVVGIPHISPTKDRVRAYVDGYAQKNLACDESLITYLENSKLNADEQIDSLIARGCTALIGTNTMITLNILNRLESENPAGEKVRVCGFVDSVFAACFNNRIPIVDEPVSEMGEHAGEMILSLINDPSHTFPVERIGCSFRNK